MTRLFFQMNAYDLESHTSAEDCGRVAAAAGVKTLVLSHLVPADDPEVTDGMWLRAAQAHFTVPSSSRKT
jgi:ribonuclease BN (tRNA processing enzyme)